MAGPALVVMAAGIGSRYGGLKQIEPVGPGGEIVIEYSVYDAIRAGFEKVVFIIRHDIEKDFREHIGRKIEDRIDTAYVFQELDALPEGFGVPSERAKPWGTAHAVLMCKNEVKTPFAVINADDFYGAGSYRLLCDFLTRANDTEGIGEYCLVGYVLKNTLSEHGHVARGVVQAAHDGLLKEIHERLKIQKFGEEVKYTEDGTTWINESPESIVSMNMWGFTPSLFGFLEDGFPAFLKENIHNPKAEYLLPVRVGELVGESRARVKILPTDDRWYGITYQQDKPFVKKAIQELAVKGIYPQRLWE